VFGFGLERLKYALKRFADIPSLRVLPARAAFVVVSDVSWYLFGGVFVVHNNPYQLFDVISTARVSYGAMFQLQRCAFYVIPH
jgi:hypothetical protein